jgi:glyceraldehyde 3-phosphate dehydrogenase
VTTIGLMGFGRIGRNVFRNVYKRDDIRIGAIADIGDATSMEYLLKFDTLVGRFPDELSIRDGHLYVYGRRVPFLAGQERGAIPPWGDLGVEIVLDATAREQTRASLQKHLDAGARRVILCTPPVEPLDFTVVMGINDQDLKREHRIVSNGSSTIHGIAHVARTLQEAFGIQKLVFTTIHSYGSAHRLADVPHEDMRRGRSAPENIIPQESRSAGMLAQLLPQLKGKVIGAAMNVPVPNGSAVDLVCWHETKVKVDDINEVVRTAASSRYPGILRYETEPIVSSDVAHSTYSAIFDSKATMVLGDKLSKTLTWFDSGWGFSHRAGDGVERFMELDAAAGAAPVSRKPAPVPVEVQ